MKLRMILTAGAAVLGLCATVSLVQSAETTEAGPLTIEHPWSRSTDTMAKTGVVYLVVKNSGSSPDKLVSASTDVAGMAELHKNVNEGGMLRMVPVDGVEIPAKGEAALKPGGFHIMLMDLKSQLKPGSTYPLKLVFEKAGPVTVQVQVVRNAGKEKPMKMDMGGMKGMN